MAATGTKRYRPNGMLSCLPFDYAFRLDISRCLAQPDAMGSIRQRLVGTHVARATSVWLLLYGRNVTRPPPNSVRLISAEAPQPSDPGLLRGPAGATPAPICSRSR